MARREMVGEVKNRTHTTGVPLCEVGVGGRWGVSGPEMVGGIFTSEVYVVSPYGTMSRKYLLENGPIGAIRSDDVHWPKSRNDLLK